MANSNFQTDFVPDRGVDARPENRPGVPMETPPHRIGGVHWESPPAQRPSPRVTRRMERPTLTPVFGTAQPPSGVSGVLRRFAYAIPEHRPRHWMLLILADRVDVLEHRLASLTVWLPVLAAAGAAAAILRRRRRTFWDRVF